MQFDNEESIIRELFSIQLVGKTIGDLYKLPDGAPYPLKVFSFIGLIDISANEELISMVVDLLSFSITFGRTSVRNLSMCLLYIVFQNV